MNVFFTALLRLSLLGSALGMLLLLLRRLLGGRVAHGVFYYLWLLVLLRLCLPAGLTLTLPAPTAVQPAEEVPGQAAPLPITPAPAAPKAPAPVAPAEDSGPDLWVVLAGIWALGTAASLGWHATGYLRFRRRVEGCWQPAAPAAMDALRALDPGIRVLDRACPLFVPLVEGGHIAADDPIAVPAVEYYLREFREWGADTLILGCTHYPLLAPLIQRYLGEGVTLVSSGREAARATGERLGQLGLLSGREAGGRSRYFVTDDAGSFSAVAEVFLETPVTDVTPVEIARLEQLEL